jgi:hypothetical protein
MTTPETRLVLFGLQSAPGEHAAAREAYQREAWSLAFAGLTAAEVERRALRAAGEAAEGVRGMARTEVANG